MADDAPRDLDDLLDDLDGMARGEARVSVREVMESIGERSFGPLLILPGLVALTPIGAIPTLPTVLAVIILLVSSEILIGRKHVWLPKFILNRSVKGDRFRKSIKAARKPSERVDRLIRPGRLGFLTGPTGTRAVAAVACLTAIAIPPLELVPFAVGAPALAITAFGLGLTSRDGLFVLIGLIASSATVGLIVWFFLFR